MRSKLGYTLKLVNMNLTLFFRLITMSVIQGGKSFAFKERLCNEDIFDKTYFFCPRVFAKDGFSVSLQMHTGNYCTSENGYRKLGHTWESVEWGFPSEEDSMLIGEDVGSISVEDLEILLENHGGIDWERTISVEGYNKLLNIK